MSPLETTSPAAPRDAYAITFDGEGDHIVASVHRRDGSILELRGEDAEALRAVVAALPALTPADLAGVTS